MHLSGVTQVTLKGISHQISPGRHFSALDLYCAIPGNELVYGLGEVLDNIKDAKPELERRREFIKLRQIESK